MNNQEKAQEISNIIASVQPTERPMLIDNVFDAIVLHQGIDTMEFKMQLEQQGLLTDYDASCNTNQAICKRKTP